jgi:uncharacterized membrane protein
VKRAADISFAKQLAGHLGKGLAILLPLGATIWVLWWIFVAADELIPTERLLGRPMRGTGIAAIVLLALFVGLLTTDPGMRRIGRYGNDALLRIPLFKIVYSAFRDFASALLVKKRFDKPVLVKLGGGFDAEVIGFVTRQNLESLGILDKVAVYFPQSYNIGGNVLILPRERLTPLDADGAQVMSFIVTGGIASTDGQADAAAAPARTGMGLRTREA